MIKGYLVAGSITLVAHRQCAQNGVYLSYHTKLEGARHSMGEFLGKLGTA